MTFGFLLGIGAAFVWSIVNLVDTYLVERFSKNSGIGALIILSSIFPGVLLPIAYELSGRNISFPPLETLILIASGILATIWISFYLIALEEEETSIVVPLIFQLTPLFALPLAFLFLNEWPTTSQLIGGAVIVIGSIILAFEHTTGKLKMRLLFLITASSVSVALMNTLFKLVAIDAAFWPSVFWHSAGILIAGVCLLFFHTQYRNQFFSFIQENMGMSLSLNGINESLTLLGDVLFAYAILLAPLALIQTTEAFQPIFVFFFMVALTLLFPKIMKEDFGTRALIQKVLGIGLVTIGTLLLYLL